MKTVIKLRMVQRSELALKLKPMLAAQAKERQRESQKNFHGNQHTSGMGQNSAPHQKSKTSDDIAKIRSPNKTKKPIGITPDRLKF
jgi:hypothetical protein